MKTEYQLPTIELGGAVVLDYKVCKDLPKPGYINYYLPRLVLYQLSVGQ